MKICGTVTDISERSVLAGVKLRFAVEETELLTIYTDAQGTFEAEQDLSDYVGKKLKIIAQKEKFEDTNVAYEVGQEDIEINIEMIAILQVKRQTPVQPTPVVIKNKQFWSKRKLIKLIGSVCVIFLVIIVVYLVARPKAAKITSFYAQPASILIGKESTLTWTTENAVTVKIDGLGKVNKSGSRKVKPSTTKTYTLSATGEGKNNVATQPCTVTVRLVIHPVIPMIHLNPENRDNR